MRRSEELDPDSQQSLYQTEYFTDNEKRKSEPYISDWQWKFDEKRFLEELREIRALKSNGRLLDVGSATGNFLRLAREANFEVIGVEFSKFASEYAQALGFNCFTGTVENAPLDPDSFDVVTMHHVLEHVPNPIDTLRAVYRVMKPDAILVIEVPNFGSFRSRINKEDWEDLRPIEHLYQYEKTTLVRLVEAAGFKKERVRTKSEVLWVLQEPLKLLHLSDRTIYRIWPHLKPMESPVDFQQKTAKRTIVDSESWDHKILLEFTRVVFFPLVWLHERLGLEKRLSLFARKPAKHDS